VSRAACLGASEIGQHRRRFLAAPGRTAGTLHGAAAAAVSWSGRPGMFRPGQVWG
jgi:hypothetical protein